MRSRTTDWFEIKIQYEKLQEDGNQKKVTEPYVVDALTFTEAEGTIIEEMSSYISGEFEVKGISKAPYKEIFFSDNPRDDKWYKTKVQFITLDEKTGEEKYSSTTYLVQGASLQGAIKGIEEVFATGMQDWKLASVAETKLMDVFEHDGTRHVNKPVEDDRPEYEDALAAELAASNAEEEGAE